MKKKILILLFIPFANFAQDTISDERYQEVIMFAIQHVNEYESSSSFYGESRRDQFRDLFKNLSTKVVNDIPAIGNYDEIITIEDYISKMQKFYVKLGVSVKIKDISNINFIDENKGTLSVFITKTVRGENSQHFITVTEDGEIDEAYVNYKDKFELELKMSFNNESMKIESINYSKVPGKLLVISPNSKSILNKKENIIPIDEFQVFINGKKHFITDYFYSINDIDKNTRISISSNDERLIGKTIITLKDFNNSGDDHLYKMKFSKTIGDINGFIFLLPLSEKVSVTSSNVNSNVTDNSKFGSVYGASISFNIDDIFFKSVDKKKKKKGSLYVKGGMTWDQLDYDILIPYYFSDFNGETFYDVDGGAYRRSVAITNYSENQKVNINNKFVMGEYRHKYAGKRGSWISGALISGSVGVGMTTISNAEFSNNATALYSGHYKEDLYNITFSENGVYDFGTFSISNNGTLSTKNVQTLLADVKLIFKLGFIPGLEDRLLLDIGFNYVHYQDNIFEEPNDEWISFDNNELNSMHNLVDIDFSNLSLKAGVSIKF
jgi:hypothetical protein